MSIHKRIQTWPKEIQTWRKQKEASQRKQKIYENSFMGKPIVVLKIIFLLVCCNTSTQGKEIVSDSMGRKFLVKQYRRIISLAPSITDILTFLGASNRVIGTTRYCNFPGEKVGGIYDPDIEKIVSLKPDIVFMLKFGSKENYDELVKRNISVFVLDFLTVDDIVSNMFSVSKLLMLGKNAYERVNAFSREIQYLFRKSKKSLKGKKFLVMYSYPEIYTASSNSLVADVIRKSGGINITDTLPYQFQTIMIGLERLISLKPDVLVISDPNFSLITNELFKYGVKSKFVYVDPMDLSPSPRITNFINKLLEQVGDL